MFRRLIEWQYSTAINPIDSAQWVLEGTLHSETLDIMQLPRVDVFVVLNDRHVAIKTGNLVLVCVLGEISALDLDAAS